MPDDAVTAIDTADAAAQSRQARRDAVLITLAFAMYSYVVAVLLAILDARANLPVILQLRAIVALAGCGFCFLMYFGLTRLDNRPFYVRALFVLLITPLIADAFVWISFLIMQTIAPTGAARPTLSQTIYGVVYWVWYFMAYAALIMALRYSVQVKAQERRWRAVQALAHAAQLRALRNQISPHFLFNTLNSISSLILDRRPAAADAMVSRLAEFFRISLTVDPLEDIRLADELLLQRHYLEIERSRFPDLTVNVDAPEWLLEALVPTLILQPIVENAVKYAVARSATPATIRIAASALPNGRLRLSVIDDGGGTAATGGAGIGLGNVRGRLANRFGEDFAFSAAPQHPRGFEVILELPLRIAA